MGADPEAARIGHTRSATHGNRARGTPIRMSRRMSRSFIMGSEATALRRYGCRTNSVAAQLAVLLQCRPTYLDRALWYSKLCWSRRQVLVRASGARSRRHRCSRGIPVPSNIFAQGGSRDCHPSVRRDHRHSCYPKANGLHTTYRPAEIRS